jgi:hypothetical protein
MDSNSLSTIRTKPSTGRAIIREITVEKNDILHNLGSGIVFHSENTNEFNANIIIENNKIAHNKQEGLALKHLVIKNLKITNNDFSCNHQTGIWLQKAHRICNDSVFTIEANRVMDSFLGYGVYLYSTCVNLENNEIFRNNLGGILISGLCNNSIFDLGKVLTISTCFIQGNSENGIFIKDFSNPVQITTCKISENTKNGVEFIRTNIEDIDLDTHKGFIELENTEISNNLQHAIIIVKYKCFLTKIVMIENQTGDILIGENTSKYVKFDNTDEIINYVPVKSKSACRSSCMIF